MSASPADFIGARAGWRPGQLTARVLSRYGALIALLILVIVFTIKAPSFFLTTNNVLQIFNQAALSGIVSCGLTMVLVSGQFDLSIGYMASLSGIMCSWLIINGIPAPVAILIALAIGALTGLFNGFLVTRLNINALVATLGTGSVLVGVNYFISTGAPQNVSDHPAFLGLAIGKWLGVPRLVYYMLAIGAILWVVLNKTDLGRNMRAIGGNVEAAKLSGVRVSLVVTVAFLLSSAAAVITGILLTASIGSGQPTSGDALTLSSFAAAFLGSTVMREGQFHIVGTLIGVVTVSTGFNGLALIGVPSYAEFLFQGLLLIAAVAFSSIGRHYNRS